MSGYTTTNKLTSTIILRTKRNIATVPKRRSNRGKAAVDAAHEAFLTNWSKLTAADRATKLKSGSLLIDTNKEAIASIMTKEQGKPLQNAW